MKSLLNIIAVLAIAAGCNKSADITFDVQGKIKIDVAGDDAETAPAKGSVSPAAKGTFEKNADLTGVKLLTADSGWYTRVDKLPVHPQSAAIIAAQPPVVASIGPRTHNDFGADVGIPYSVGRGFPPVPVQVTAYPGESDLGPHPIPLDAPIEPGPDKHLVYLDLDSGKLYELGMAARQDSGFTCEAAAVWSIHKSYDQRELGWTSADAAGLPILPGLVRYDEMKRALAKPDPAEQHLGHALRFTLKNTGHGFVAPARHYASTVPYSLPGRPPMGMRVRINPKMDLSPFNPPTQVLLRTLQLYGGILCDNGASWFFTGTHDERWSEYWEAITGNVEGKRGFKSFAGPEFLENMQVLEFDDVTTGL
jgi:hypothetical protein